MTFQELEVALISSSNELQRRDTFVREVASLVKKHLVTAFKYPNEVLVIQPLDSNIEDSTDHSFGFPVETSGEESKVGFKIRCELEQKGYINKLLLFSTWHFDFCDSQVSISTPEEYSPQIVGSWHKPSEETFITQIAEFTARNFIDLVGKMSGVSPDRLPKEKDNPNSKIYLASEK